MSSFIKHSVTDLKSVVSFGGGGGGGGGGSSSHARDDSRQSHYAGAIQSAQDRNTNRGLAAMGVGAAIGGSIAGVGGAVVGGAAGYYGETSGNSPGTADVGGR